MLEGVASFQSLRGALGTEKQESGSSSNKVITVREHLHDVDLRRQSQTHSKIHSRSSWVVRGLQCVLGDRITVLKHQQRLRVAKARSFVGDFLRKPLFGGGSYNAYQKPIRRKMTIMNLQRVFILGDRRIASLQ